MLFQFCAVWCELLLEGVNVEFLNFIFLEKTSEFYFRKKIKS